MVNEPAWAIGTGRNADLERAYRTMRAIGGEIADGLGPAVARAARCLHRSSVNAANVATHVELPNSHGCLVDGSNFKSSEFEGMVAAVAEVYERARTPGA